MVFLRPKEEELTLIEVPAAVKKSLEARSAGRKVQSVMKTTQDDKVFYKIELTNPGKQEIFQFTADGKIFEQDK